MTFILGVSGKKQSGKTTLVEGLIPFFNNGMTVKAYSFADAIKEFAVNVLGLSPEQVNGTDEEKNSLTSYLWDCFPAYIRWDNAGRKYRDGNSVRHHEPAKIRIWEETEDPDKDYFNLQIGESTYISSRDLRSGPMSAREVMQVFGTDIGRNMFGQRIWVDATFRAIDRDGRDAAIIPDIRFPSELDAIIANKGYIIRLERDVSDGDRHPSETALDRCDWSVYNDSVCIIPDCGIEEARDLSRDWLITRFTEKNERHTSNKISS